MARIYPLFSSSKGNAVFVGSPENGILIDAGVCCKKLTDGLEGNGISPKAVRAVFITHEHSDHIKGLAVFTKKYGVPVFAKRLTLGYLVEKMMICGSSKANEIGDAPVEAGGFQVTSFETSHDSLQSCGYRIETPDGKVCCICTDLGYVSDTVHENLVGSDLVLLESNYDKEMLRSGPYPFYLKQRIASSRGHLCNDDSAREISRLVKSGTAQVILGHLSQENNTPDIAGNTVINAMPDLTYKKDYLLKVAPVETHGEVAAF